MRPHAVCMIGLEGGTALCIYKYLDNVYIYQISTIKDNETLIILFFKSMEFKVEICADFLKRKRRTECAN